jgi:hypothetical protein
MIVKSHAASFARVLKLYVRYNIYARDCRTACKQWKDPRSIHSFLLTSMVVNWEVVISVLLELRTSSSTIASFKGDIHKRIEQTSVADAPHMFSLHLPRGQILLTGTA